MESSESPNTAPRKCQSERLGGKCSRDIGNNCRKLFRKVPVLFETIVKKLSQQSTLTVIVRAALDNSFWDHFMIILGSLWDHFRIILGSLWDRFGIILGSF